MSAALRSPAASSLVFVGACNFSSALPLVAAAKNTHNTNHRAKLCAFQRAGEECFRDAIMVEGRGGFEASPLVFGSKRAIG